MKKHLTLLFIFLQLFFLSFSQNGGIQRENNVIKIDYFQYSNGKHTFKISNKVNCETSISVDMYNNSSTSHSIQANSFILIDVVGTQSSLVKLRAKRISGSLCSSNPDNGWVEMESPLVLPVTFKNQYEICFYPNKTMDFQFEVEQTSDIKMYYIKYSIDGINWKYVKTLTPNKSIGTQKYKVQIK